MFGLFVLILTFLIAAGAAVLALKLPDELYYWRFVSSAIAVGLLLGAIMYVQQMKTLGRATGDRDAAITEASKRVAEETTKNVTEAVGGQYEQQVKALTNQVVELEAQLSAQGKNVDVIKDDHANDSGKQSSAGLPSIFWIEDDSQGSAQVRFRIYGPLNVPAFVAVCDRPCKAVSGQVGTGSEGLPLIGSTDRKVAGFIFNKPRPMPPGSAGTVTLQSLDKGAVRVMTFRILRESEIPAGLK